MVQAWVVQTTRYQKNTLINFGNQVTVNIVRIRIHMFSVLWIRIRIKCADPDTNPAF